MEKKTKKSEQMDKFKIRDFLMGPYAIIVVLIAFAIGLLAYTRFLAKSDTLYMFAGYEKNFSFFGGTIYEGLNVNYFSDSKVLYTGEDISLYDYELGYYIKDDGEYRPISVTKSHDVKENSKGASLKEVLMGTGFSFTETHRDAVFLSKENIDNLDNLVFLIRGKDAKGEEIKMEIALEVDKITK